MYKIDKTSFGSRLTFGDSIAKSEMENWLKDSITAVASAPANFQVLIDMRTLKPLSPDAQEVMQEGQKLYKQKGMERSCVILDNAIITMQFKRIAQQTGIYAFERYINASQFSDWESKAVAWLEKGTDPDL